jgi:hypothetical protein
MPASGLSPSVCGKLQTATKIGDWDRLTDAQWIHESNHDITCWVRPEFGQS